MATRPSPGKTLRPSRAFARVVRAGLAMPGVAHRTRYDGSPVLERDGCFMAGLARHASEPDALIVRWELETRDELLGDAPDTYFVPPYYERHPVVLARLSRLDDVELRDLLNVSWRLTGQKTGRARRSSAPGGSRTPGTRTRARDAQD